MKKNTILKKLELHEEKIIKSITDLQDFLHSVDDEEISQMADDLCEGIQDFLHENDICNLENIQEFIENTYEQA
jgi:hypothetical protein